MFLTYRGHLCLSIPFSLFLWTGISQNRAEVLGVTFPYRAPKGDYVTQQDRYHTFRIPGMVVAGDGSILAFAEGRRGRGRDPMTDSIGGRPNRVPAMESSSDGRIHRWRPTAVSWFRPKGYRSRTPDGPATAEPFVYYSDDHGRSWKVGRATGGPAANEDEVVELTDGRLLLDARQTRGAFRRRHISADGGLTWGPDLSDTIALTRVDGSMVRYSATRAGHDKDRILFSAPQGRDGLNRTRITVWISYDEGKTSVNPVKFSDGFAAYSVLQRLSDGTI